MRDHLERIYACLEDCRGALVEIVARYPVPSAQPELRSIHAALTEAHQRLRGLPPTRIDAPPIRGASSDGPATCPVGRPLAVVDAPYAPRDEPGGASGDFTSEEDQIPFDWSFFGRFVLSFPHVQNIRIGAP